MKAKDGMNNNVRTLFLVDGAGALVSTFFLGYLLVLFNAYIGMPIPILYALASIAGIFAIFSWSCYFLKPVKWKFFLKMIRSANLFYSGVTLSLTLNHIHQLTLLGTAYFVSEISILWILAYYETRMIKRN